MKKPIINQSKSTMLRQDAEEELGKRDSSDTFAELNKLKLIHELEVHQIELEMQNEELKAGYIQLEALKEKYHDLYDFAPSGYLSLSEEGDILDLNFAAAALLGGNRKFLKHTRFRLYITQESLLTFDKIYHKTLLNDKKVSGELSLLSKGEKPVYVHINAHKSENINVCLLTMVDISERKQAEMKLAHRANQIKALNDCYQDWEFLLDHLKEEVNELLIKAGGEKKYSTVGYERMKSERGM